MRTRGRVSMWGGAAAVIGAILALLVAAAAPSLFGRVQTLAARQADDAARTLARIPRPFEHRTHERVSCLECHGAGEAHRTLRVRTPRDCASCHHDERRGFECAACHRADELADQRVVAATLSLPVWLAPRVRTLPFGHVLHRDIACRECHATPVTLAPNRACASCHTSHHAAAAECASCHEAAEPRTTHAADAHLGCDGAGCHAAGSVPSPSSSRTLCLVCHAEQRAHEPAGNCASCHRIPDRRSDAGRGVNAAGS